MKNSLGIEIKNFNKFIEILERANKKIVCVDIDNTLANVNIELKKLGVNIKKYPAKLPKNFWVTRGIEILKKAPLLIETVYIIELFEKAGAEIVFATARHPALKNITNDWLKKHHLQYYDVFYVHRKILVEADTYIEDSPQEIKQLLKQEKKVISPSWKYNKKIKSTVQYEVGGSFI